MECWINDFATQQYYPVTEINAFPAEFLEDACERYGLSEIHKIVWGISYDDLDTKVRACPEAIDRLDVFGYTALDYAIRFGKSNHVRVLLSHGADIGRRPHYLFWTAVHSGNCASIRLLLDQDLRPNDLLFDTDEDDDSVFPFGVMPSWNDCCVDCEPEVDKLLIDYEFNFNTRDSTGGTALMACCRRLGSHDRIKRMKSLLERGVDLGITDNNGQTAIHHALYNDNLRAFEMLTKYGARLGARTFRGETVLHIAVKSTKQVAMVRALSSADIMQLDLDAPRDDGKIAFNVLRDRAAGKRIDCQRIDCPRFPPRLPQDHVQIIRAFEALFQEIQEHQGVPLEDRYPALHIAAPGERRAAEPVENTYPASSDHTIHEVSDEDDIPADPDSNEPICAPPGAWPE